MTEQIVLCVLKSGGKEYGPKNVQTLKDSLKTFSDARLICLSDVEVPCERIPLKHNWPGWWSKLELFSHVFDQSVLYVDLDTTFVDDPTPLWREEFTMLKNIWRQNDVGSGIMSWNGNYKFVYDAFTKNPQKYISSYKTAAKWGDQGFIRDHLKTFPKTFEEQYAASYKGHCTDFLRAPFKIPHKDVCVVYFHGTPRPWEVPAVSKL